MLFRSKENLNLHMRQLLMHNITQIKMRDEDEWGKDRLVSDFTTLKEKLQKLEKDMRDQTDKNVCCCMEITELRSKVELMFNDILRLRSTNNLNENSNPIITSNGVFIWKITSFSEERRKAIDGICTSIYSPSFYTNPYGYKMCLRIYLNGDGMGKGSYISLFLVIMQGEFDALQRWPFKDKVTFVLLDQSYEKFDIVDSFKPAASMLTSFGRPRKSMNVAAGSPLFFPLQDLNKYGYIVDDTIYFKVIIDNSTK